MLWLFVELAAYLGTVVTIAVIAIGAMYVIVGLLGKRVDELRSDVGAEAM